MNKFSTARILVIDDNPAVATALRLLFSLDDLDTVSAENPALGLARLKVGDIDLVVQDMNFSADTTSGDEGIALFRQIRILYPDLPIILLTAWTHLNTAVDLVRAGAADYLSKPWDDHKLRASVRNLLELGQATRALAQSQSNANRSQRDLRSQYDLCGAIFADPASERLLTLATQIARADIPVLITGPNGAGKEKIAEIIQANSNVRKGPFVTLNCGAIPSELMEAELFGSEAGAYTGANKARVGKFEAADGGTLFLDEIGNLPLSGQMKLLRVIETGRFAKLGANKEIQVKVRLISATNADLAAMIKLGQFREDLYYRLNVIELAMPPLSARRYDILPLARYFLKPELQLDALAERALLQHSWPGNVRELKNVMQRAGVLAKNNLIGIDDLALPSATTYPNEADELDRETLQAALQKSRGNVSQTAQELGLSRQALYRRMERFGIAKP